MKALIRRGLLVAAIALAPVISACGAPAAKAARSSKPMETKPIVLGAAPVRAEVAAPKSLKSGKWYLVIRGLRVDVDPGVIYDVYVDLPAGAKPVARDPRHVGTINFYGVPPVDDPNRAFFSFEVTGALRERKQKETTVTFIPQGRAAQNAKVTIARVELAQE